ncbi:hypothetical protein [Ktedonobacter racemifer]|uniref:Uncharacterized protein n=1 Tax=Ktedonobacter racemifer DSM 44963 TaxID=485913 RepID=D6THM4_KTERA|nr:hypothetical protein [Ktedonobacter racemifer]EFH89029.1 hypothetical protein Krac_10552 [Ktedonobacter racemifer DSM 44963]
MNVSNGEQQRKSESAHLSAVNTHFTGFWLVLARTVWLALVLPSLGLFVVGLPAYYQRVQMPCASVDTCTFAGEMTAKGLRALSTLGISVSGYATLNVIFWVTIIAIWSVMGFLIFWRKSNEGMALLAAFALAMFNITYPGLSTSALTSAYPVLVLPTMLVGVLGQVAIDLFFLLFPSGRLVPRWTGLIIPLIIIQAASVVFPPTSPLNQNNWPGWLNGLFALVIYGSILIAQIYRYRHASTSLQRQQTKWVVFGMSIVVTGLFVFGLLFSLFFPALTQPDTPYSLITLVYPLLWLLLPFSIGIAILRYRLYDIDVLINRTLVYGGLSGILVALYAGLTIGLESLVGRLTGQSSQPAIIVVSTLAIATLFQPLRHRLQDVIDRRFYRRKYDAQKTLTAFASTLHSEVDLQQLSEHVLVVVNETMQPMHASLWLYAPKPGIENVSRRVEPPKTRENDS